MNEAACWQLVIRIELALARALLAAAATLAPLPAGAFTGNEIFTVSVILAGTGSGRVVSSQNGYIDCPGHCTTPYLVGNWLTLNAAADPGSFFAGWSGGCSGTGVCNIFVARDYVVTATFALEGVDLSVAQSTSSAPAATGKDRVYAISATNAGSATATNVTLLDTIDATTSFVWATPGCSPAAGTVTCALGSLPAGASTSVTVVVRPSVAGSITNSVSVGAAEVDTHYTNNASATTIAVDASPTGFPTLRYRLYSPVTLEHHFTTDLNEYTVLGGLVGTWVQEGTVGQVLDDPGSFAGVAATPYYRLYNTSMQWHHWTTDANEYYTLIQFPHWKGEGVDGYILPTQAAGTIPLYRLFYPFIAGLHQWTIDANEYTTLINTYGWIGEPGAGFVIP